MRSTTLSTRTPCAAPVEVRDVRPPGSVRPLPRRKPARALALAEAFAYSSGLAAAIGAALALAVGRVLGSPDPRHAAAIVGFGAFTIYAVDRLRDVELDRPSSPLRTAFVLRHRSALVAASALSALALAALLASAPPPVAALGVAIGAVGLLHRRLKRSARWKIGYVASAWTAACVGIPLLAGASAVDRRAAAAAALATIVVGGSLVANLIASNLRDGKRSRSVGSAAHALGAARAIAIAAAVLAGVSPEPVAALAWIPAAEAVALAAFRSSERYAHIAVDGALLLGAGLAVLAT